MEVKIYSKQKTTTLNDKATGELKTITYDAVYLDLNGQSIEIKAVYKDDKKMLKYIAKECVNHEAKEEPKVSE